MAIEGKNTNGENNNLAERFSIQLTDSILYDRMHTLAAEYSVPVDVLVNAAVGKFIHDIDFVRKLRIGKVEL